NRRNGHRRRHSGGSAYVAAAGGIVVWNAVSKQATAGTSGRTVPTASSAASDFGWCSGARSVSAASRSRTPPSIRTGPVNSVPPCTMRWPTASTPPASETNVRIADVSIPRPTACREAAATSWSSSRTESLRLDDPALTTRTRTSVGPGPRAYCGRVLAFLARVGAGADAFVCHVLAELGGVRHEARHAVDHVDDQVEAVEVVEHDHVERRGGRALLLVPAHVEVVVVGAPVRQAVDEPGVAVVREDDGAVGREEGVEFHVR